jgi:plastocyanin
MPLSPSQRALALLASPLALVQPALAQSPEKAEAVKISINVIPGVIRFETTQFDVHVGARVTLTFANDCVMPHNVVILKPDA